MSVEYLGEKIFYDEVESHGQIWVARGNNTIIYAMEIDRRGFSLPVWSSSQKVLDFLKHARLVGPKYEPYAVPLGVFTEAWLSDQRKAIVELQINPDGKSPRVLVMTTAEFRHSQQTPT